MSNTSALAINNENNNIRRKGMTSREIKAAMILKDISIKDIAAQAGVSTSAVAQTITSYPTSRYIGLRVRPYIASALDRKVEDIWPV